MANSADPDQLSSSEASWSGSTLFAKVSARPGLRSISAFVSVQSDQELYCLKALDKLG